MINLQRFYQIIGYEKIFNAKQLENLTEEQKDRVKTQITVIRKTVVPDIEELA